MSTRFDDDGLLRMRVFKDSHSLALSKHMNSYAVEEDNMVLVDTFGLEDSTFRTFDVAEVTHNQDCMLLLVTAIVEAMVMAMVEAMVEAITRQEPEALFSK